jgi:hypothetical protein
MRNEGQWPLWFWVVDSFSLLWRNVLIFVLISSCVLRCSSHRSGHSPFLILSPPEDFSLHVPTQCTIRSGRVLLQRFSFRCWSSVLQSVPLRFFIFWVHMVRLPPAVLDLGKRQSVLPFFHSWSPRRVAKIFIFCSIPLCVMFPTHWFLCHLLPVQYGPWCSSMCRVGTFPAAWFHRHASQVRRPGISSSRSDVALPLRSHDQFVSAAESWPPCGSVLLAKVFHFSWCWSVRSLLHFCFLCEDSLGSRAEIFFFPCYFDLVGSWILHRQCSMKCAWGSEKTC